jgi:hypothetical protein
LNESMDFREIFKDTSCIVEVKKDRTMERIAYLLIEL